MVGYYINIENEAAAQTLAVYYMFEKGMMANYYGGWYLELYSLHVHKIDFVWLLPYDIYFYK